MVVQHGRGLTILNDTYNANPQSMKLSIKTLALMSAPKRIAVLGDMLELGTTSAQSHEEVLQVAVDNSDVVIVQGGEFASAATSMNNSNVVVASDHAGCIDAVREHAVEGTAVLVKGSRGLQMENVVQGLL